MKPSSVIDTTPGPDQPSREDSLLAQLKKAQRALAETQNAMARVNTKMTRIQLAILDTECECECSHVNGHQDIGYDDECGPMVCLRCRIQEILRVQP